jgi:hypothetical protein
MQYGSNYITGRAPAEATRTIRDLSEKDKVETWFINPLMKMNGDKAFVALMICFPLLETIIRHELAIPENEEVTLYDKSPALHWFAKFMTIPDQSARTVWDAFRNGLVHRAMVKGALSYELTGKEAGRPAQMVDETIKIFVWDLRKAVVEKLQEHHKRLWKGSGNDLPAIYIGA